MKSSLTQFTIRMQVLFSIYSSYSEMWICIEQSFMMFSKQTALKAKIWFVVFFLLVNNYSSSNNTITFLTYQSINQSINQKSKKAWAKRNVLSWCVNVSTEWTRRSCDGRLFQAHGATTANGRSSSHDVVQGTSTEPNVAHMNIYIGYIYIYQIFSNPSYTISTFQDTL